MRNVCHTLMDRRILALARLCSWVVLLLICQSSLLQAADDTDGFVPIFDGKTLNSWNGKNQFWSVRDGAITGQTSVDHPTSGNTFLIFQDEVGDFELHLKFKILSGNSGIQYRSVDRGNSVVHGYQADVDSSDRFMGDLYDEGGRGILAKAGDKVVISPDGRKTIVGKTAERQAIASAVQWEDWNEYVAIAKGKRLVQRINGLDVVDVYSCTKGRRCSCSSRTSCSSA